MTATAPRRPAGAGRPAVRRAAAAGRPVDPAVAGGEVRLRRGRAVRPAHARPGRRRRAGAVRARARRRRPRTGRTYAALLAGPARPARRSTCPASAESGPAAARRTTRWRRRPARSSRYLEQRGARPGAPVRQLDGRRGQRAAGRRGPAGPGPHADADLARRCRRCGRGAGSDFAMPLLLLPGVGRCAAAPAGRAAAGAAGGRADARLCFADPAAVPRNRLRRGGRRGGPAPGAALGDGRVHRVAARAGPVATWRSGRGRCGGSAAWCGRRRWSSGATEDKLVPVELAPGPPRRSRTARLLVLPGVGHVAQLEAPETTAGRPSR